MKKALVIVLAVLALVGCKDQMSQLSGTYSYKISGVATAEGKEQLLTDEQGAMEIIRLNADSALLTFNALAGAAYTTSATIAEKQITLLPYQRSILIGTTDYPVTASGAGTIYDGTIVIKLEYHGADLDADDLTLLCKKN